MKICGIVCEYNPFHNGHAYLLDRARSESGCDAVVCVMSGDFTQRGEIACLSKQRRARHAIEAGADLVIELPVVFATAPAELFARGAVKLLASLPAFSALAFGSECADKDLIIRAAKATMEEGRSFKSKLRSYLKTGKSLARARLDALLETGETEAGELLRSPNNILAVEYQKSLFLYGSSADIFPVKRTGAGYTDEELHVDFSSAAGIRRAVAEKNLRAARKNVPPFVADDLEHFIDPEPFRKIAVYSVLSHRSDSLRKITDCSEGLENRIKALAHSNHDYQTLIEKATTKRYISSRIRRILVSAALGITDELVRRCLRADLYCKVLAVRKERADDLCAALGKGAYPAILRKSDLSRLGKTAAECFAKDMLAADLFNLVAGKAEPDNMQML